MEKKNPHSSIGCNLGGAVSEMKLPSCPNMEVQEKPKKEADHPRTVGGRFHKQGTYKESLSWAATRRVDLCTH